MLVPPIPTPFDTHGNPDWDALRVLVEHVRESVDGVLLFGSNGEAVHLTAKERERGLASVKPSCPFWVGCGDETVAQTLEHVTAAADAGAQGVLLTPPRYYAGALGTDGLVRYFEEVADASHVPTWIYHIPQLTRTELPLDVVKRLSSHENIVGIKDSSGQLARVAYYASQGLELEVCTGHASTVLGALALGADGAILAAANLAPSPYRALMTSWFDGDVEAARRWQQKLEPLGRVLGLGGFVLLKQALRHLGLPAGFPRAPYPRESKWWPELASELASLGASKELRAPPES